MAHDSETAGRPRDRRIVRHIQNLFLSGTDGESFAAALQEVRLDTQLTKVKKVAIYKTLAQQSAQAYLSAITGRPINLEPAVQTVLSPEDYEAYLKDKPSMPEGVKPIDPFAEEPEEIDLEAESNPKPYELKAEAEAEANKK